MNDLSGLKFIDMKPEAQARFRLHAKAHAALIPVELAAGERWIEAYRTGAPNVHQLWQEYQAVWEQMRIHTDETLRIVEDLESYA